MAAVGGAVWSVAESGALELTYQINLRETRLAEQEEDLNRHGMLLHHTMQSGEGTLIAPHSGEGDDSGAANPTD